MFRFTEGGPRSDCKMKLAWTEEDNQPPTKGATTKMDGSSDSLTCGKDGGEREGGRVREREQHNWKSSRRKICEDEDEMSPGK